MRHIISQCRPSDHILMYVDENHYRWLNRLTKSAPEPTPEQMPKLDKDAVVLLPSTSDQLADMPIAPPDPVWAMPTETTTMSPDAALQYVRSELRPFDVLSVDFCGNIICLTYATFEAGVAYKDFYPKLQAKTGYQIRVARTDDVNQIRDTIQTYCEAHGVLLAHPPIIDDEQKYIVITPRFADVGFAEFDLMQRIKSISCWHVLVNKAPLALPSGG